MHFLTIRNHLLKKYPEIRATFNRTHPEHLLYGLGLISLIVFLSVKLYAVTSIPLLCLGSLVLGICYASLSFFNHELMHGTMVKSKKWKKIFSYPGFFIFSLSPELWETWHNQLHHFHTNRPGADPDSSFTLERLQSLKYGRKVLKYFPGSRNPLSAIFAVSAFSVQVLNVLWLRSRFDLEHAHFYTRMNRRRAVMETFIYYILWLIAAVVLGPLKFVFLLMIPAMVTNAWVVSYIGILHTTRPLSDENHPLETTISVRSPKIMDYLFFNFSHHIEHHVFPESNYRYYPMMQKALKEEFPEDYSHLDHGHAINLTLSTPRVYRDKKFLYDPESGRSVDLVGLKIAKFEKSFLRHKNDETKLSIGTDPF